MGFESWGDGEDPDEDEDEPTSDDLRLLQRLVQGLHQPPPIPSPPPPPLTALPPPPPPPPPSSAPMTPATADQIREIRERRELTDRWRSERPRHLARRGGFADVVHDPEPADEVDEVDEVDVPREDDGLDDARPRHLPRRGPRPAHGDPGAH